MPTYQLLWIDTVEGARLQEGWQADLEEFQITRVTGLVEAGVSPVAANADCALVTVPLHGMEGLDLMDDLRAIAPAVPVVFWNPEMSAADAARLIRGGAHNCIGYRDTLEVLRESLESAAEESRRRKRARERDADADEPWRASLVGESKAIQSVAETIRLVGSRRCTVLITGETGTGKEVVARALHLASPRAKYPMVAINCSALPEHLLEAELFGHVKGAFTGAVQSRVGRFEQAHKSTLFLDEIGDMPIELQAKLLRVLQDRIVQRLGSSEATPVDVRVIAATNVNLLERVRQGRFREDLYYRLNVVPVKIPNLKQRETDIPLLVDYFVKKTCISEGIPLKRVSAEAMTRLQANAWPGNIRQLENAVEMAVVMSGARELLSASDFGLSNGPTLRIVPLESGAFQLPESLDFESAVTSFERAMLEQALRKTSGNKTAAAELLGLKRTTLIMKLRSFDSIRACAG